MKRKTKQALKGLRETLEIHKSETTYGAVEVDKDELERVLRWAQNSASVWFQGDRVAWTGARVGSMPWLREDMTGTVLEDSAEDGIARVEWDGVPDELNRVRMYHNEIKLVKP